MGDVVKFEQRTVLVVGDRACGKTSLLRRFARRPLIQGYEPTTKPLDGIFNVQADGYIVELTYWDTPGECMANLLPETDVHVILLCFSLGDVASLDNVRSGCHPTLQQCYPNIPIILVGLKSDRVNTEGEDVVTQDQRRVTVENLNVSMFLQCSAVTGSGVTDVFREAARLSVSNSAESTPRPTPTPSRQASVEVPASAPSETPRPVAKVSKPLNTKPLLDKTKAPAWLKKSFTSRSVTNRPHILSSTTPVVEPLIVRDEQGTIVEGQKPGPRKNSCPTPKMGDPETQVTDRDTLLGIIESEFKSHLPASRPSRREEIKEKMSLYPFALHYLDQFLNALVTLEASEEHQSKKTAFEDDLNQWLTFSPLKTVVSHEVIRSRIMEMLIYAKAFSLACKDASIHIWPELIDYVIDQDIYDMEATFITVLDTHPKFAKRIGEFEKEEVLAMMDILQMLLDRSAVLDAHGQARIKSSRRLERFLRAIVKSTGILPRAIVVQGVKRSGKNAIAGGGFADVWKGEWRGEVVALKVVRMFGINSASAKQAQSDFAMEALIWRRFDNPYVLPFYGVSVDEFDPQIALVAPWMHNGTTIAYLKKHPDADRVKMITNIAEGLAYLHDLRPRVVHGDLRAGNVLMDKDHNPRIADFGLAKIIDSQATSMDRTSFTGKGSMRWQAPELLGCTRFPISKPDGSVAAIGVTTMSDVYAYACVCLEIFTEKVPYHHLREGEVIMEVAVNNRKPLRPSAEFCAARGLDDTAWNVLQDCWEADPQKRPNMVKVYSRLVDMMDRPEVKAAMGYSIS